MSIASTLSVGFCAHESGHGFGLEHSFSISSRGDLTNDQRPGAYGDWYDIMSWARTASFSPARFPPAGPSLNAPTLYKLGWLQDDHVLSIVTGLPGNLEVTLMALHSEMTNGYRMTRIIESQSNKIYTIEFRQAKGWDRGLNGDRIVIHELRTHSQLVKISGDTARIAKAWFLLAKVFVQPVAFMTLLGVLIMQ